MIVPKSKKIRILIGLIAVLVLIFNAGWGRGLKERANEILNLDDEESDDESDGEIELIEEKSGLPYFIQRIIMPQI